VLRLSPSGRALLGRTERAVAAAEKDLLAPLNQEQREQLHALVRLLADGVELCPTADDEC
jgi:DNA-binding MarR family transcriptional regulator